MHHVICKQHVHPVTVDGRIHAKHGPQRWLFGRNIRRDLRKNNCATLNNDSLTDSRYVSC